MGGAVFPPCFLTWDQTMVVVMKIMGTSFKRSHVHTAVLSAPSQAAGHCQTMPPPETPGHSQASRSVTCGSLPLAPRSSCIQGIFCALHESVSPVLCKFWQLYGGIDGHLLQEGLCHTQVYCIQNPWPCRSLLLTHTSTGDTKTQFWLSLCGVSGS